jgi:hypothetical protein
VSRWRFSPGAGLMAGLEAAAGGGRVAVVCALAGGRGVGESQVAGAYARARIRDGCALVVWVDAETPGQMLAGLAAVAERLGVADPGGVCEWPARCL